MANILYQTDYNTNIYLLYLDNVPQEEVGSESPLFSSTEWEAPAQIEGGIENLHDHQAGAGAVQPSLQIPSLGMGFGG